MKYSWEFKLECVEKYLKGEWTETPGCAKSQSTFRHNIIEWTRRYKLYGAAGLKHKPTNKEWTAQERFELVSQVLAGKSIMSTAMEAGINKGQLYQWVRKYKQYGYDGLELRRGRKPKDPDMSKKTKTNELDKSDYEKLKLLERENEYLRAENAYLKKLRALIVQKQAESSVKAKRQQSLEDSGKKDTD
ncbi:MAG: helix-turn-helix domain-containing protein [Erysipelotrichaceae bacterium]|nr:helix-turn-helix domain-containing protein [Erysipelotrichaceae bacterium]